VLIVFVIQLHVCCISRQLVAFILLLFAMRTWALHLTSRQHGRSSQSATINMLTPL